MRLWHQDLIKYLPVEQLNGQHRECCALRGKGWGIKYDTVDYVFSYNPAWLSSYHWLVLEEKRKRGHINMNETWYDPLYRGKTCVRWTHKELNTDELQMYDTKIIYPEHNEVYLRECLDNLSTKGIQLNFPIIARKAI